MFGLKYSKLLFCFTVIQRKLWEKKKHFLVLISIYLLGLFINWFATFGKVLE